MTDCPPRFSTPRTPSRKTDGAIVARIAAALHTNLMPWQRRVADVALERREDGQLAYREVIVHVPRQQGKSRLLLTLMLARALSQPQQKVRYTAQSGLMARTKLVDDWLPELQSSPLASTFTTRLVNGSEALRFENGSRIELVSTSRKSAHGLVVDLALVDEAFALTDNRMEQSLKPAMVTRPSPQLWVVSTAGTPVDSPFLWSKVEAGRQLAAAGLDSGVAYFEWSASEDAEIGDPAVWAACMPALGRTVPLEAIESDFASMQPGEFARAYLNQWRAPSSEPVIDAEEWRALADPETPSPRPEVLAIDVSPDRSSACIAGAARTSGGRIHVGVLEHGSGVHWVPDRAAELFRDNSISQVVVDSIGPAAALTQSLEEAHVRRITLTTARQMAEACGMLFDAVKGRTIAHRGTPELTAAVDGARKRQLGDAWAWSRRGSSNDITPLVSVTLAHWARRQPRGIPLAVFGLDVDELDEAPIGRSEGSDGRVSPLRGRGRLPRGRGVVVWRGAPGVAPPGRTVRRRRGAAQVGRRGAHRCRRGAAGGALGGRAGRARAPSQGGAPRGAAADGAGALAGGGPVIRARIGTDEPEMTERVIALHRAAKIDRMILELMNVPPPVAGPDETKENEDVSKPR